MLSVLFLLSSISYAFNQNTSLPRLLSLCEGDQILIGVSQAESGNWQMNCREWLDLIGSLYGWLPIPEGEALVGFSQKGLPRFAKVGIWLLDASGSVIDVDTSSFRLRRRMGEDMITFGGEDEIRLDGGEDGVFRIQTPIQPGITTFLSASRQSALTITHQGNIGIGTVRPAGNLDIKEVRSNTGILHIWGNVVDVLAQKEIRFGDGRHVTIAEDQYTDNILSLRGDNGIRMEALSGALIVNSGEGIVTDKICLGGVCRSSWVPGSRIVTGEWTESSGDCSPDDPSPRVEVTCPLGYALDDIEIQNQAKWAPASPWGYPRTIRWGFSHRDEWGESIVNEVTNPTRHLIACPTGTGCYYQAKGIKSKSSSIESEPEYDTLSCNGNQYYARMRLRIRCIQD